MNNFNKPLTKSVMKMLYFDDNTKIFIKDLYNNADNIKKVKRLSRKNTISDLNTFVMRLELLTDYLNMEKINGQTK